MEEGNPSSTGEKMIIHPEVFVTPDCPTIRFRESKDSVDLEKKLPQILHAQGWCCGTYFHVQFVSHDRTKLLASTRFVVSEESESLQTSDNPYQPMTKTIYNLKATQIEPWWKKEEKPQRGRPKKTEDASKAVA